MVRWMTACHWQLQMRRSCRARTTTPPPSLHSAQLSASSPGMDADIFRILSNAVEELGLEWSPPEEPSRSRLDEWFLPGRHQAPRQQASPFFPEVHNEITKSWRAPYSSCLRASSSSTLTSVKGAEEKGYDSLTPLDESVVTNLCLPTASGWKAKGAHGRSMASLVVLERHLWLNLTEMKEAYKVPFLDSQVSPTGLFGPAVEGLTEHFASQPHRSRPRQCDTSCLSAPALLLLLVTPRWR